MMCGVLLGSVSCDISCFLFLFSMNHASAFGKAEGMGGPVVFKFLKFSTFPSSILMAGELATRA